MSIQRRYSILGALLIVLLCFCFLWWMNGETMSAVFTLQKYRKKRLQRTSKFTNNVLTYMHFRRVCYLGKDPEGIKDLPHYISMLRRSKKIICQNQYKIFESIYKLRVKFASVISLGSINSEIINKSNQLKERAKNQSLIFVDNLYSLEGVVFNLARVATPPVWGNVSGHVRAVVEKAKKGCDFCAVANNTAADTFGRMESKHTVIVSNAFKIEKYHGLAILKKHHPLLWSQEQFIDCITLILRWFKRVHEVSSDDVYRIIYWDLLSKASVSQMHPHMHLTFGNYKYYAKWNELHNAGLLFSKEHRGSNYWTNLLQLYTSLGLSVTFGNASVLAYLTPKRDYEVIVISEQPSLDFFRLVFFTIRSFIDDLKEPCVSMGWVFPKLYSNTKNGDELPMIFKLVSRGDPLGLQSDISSFDLYGTPNINRDPYKAIKIIRETVKRRAREKFHWTTLP